MAITALTTTKVVVATKASMLGAVKVGLAAGPFALPLVIAAGVGSLLFMDIAATKTANMLMKNSNT